MSHLSGGWVAALYTLIALVTLLGIGAALRRFGFTFLGCLMDTGDGQGGPPLRRTEPFSLGDHVIPMFRDPAHDCDFCAPRFNGSADCGCALPCKDPSCGALAWQAVANTEEWKQ